MNAGRLHSVNVLPVTPEGKLLFPCPRCGIPTETSWYGPCKKCNAIIQRRAQELAAWRALCNYSGRLHPPPKEKERQDGPPPMPQGGEPPKGRCRSCGDYSWLADDQGPVHACCARVPEGEQCMACRYASSNRKDQGLPQWLPPDLSD